jgi:hypothetical protein
MLLVSSGAFAQGSEERPPEWYVSRDACPFQACIYREWTALEGAAVFDKPDGAIQIDRLRPGERVHALTGEVHSKPLITLATHDFAEPGALSLYAPRIIRGETFYLLHSLGEGLWRVWHRGQVTEVMGAWTPKDPLPETAWWVQVITPRGLTGWVRAEGNFSGSGERLPLSAQR